MHDKQMITAVVANETGEIFDLEGYAAVGMAGPELIPLTTQASCALPYGSELMRLPDRVPILYNLAAERFEMLDKNPFEPEQDLYPVAAFNSPGHVVSRVCAYRERSQADFLPLFSYGAVGWQGDGFYSAAIQVDTEPRQDLRYMKQADVLEGIEFMRGKLPENRLRNHLERCALEYGCPAGKNFFLGRFEAPLPTARTCNAACLGCLSLQPDTDIPCSQERIDFTPDPWEIAGVALEHIARVEKSVVSFGQGCEGDPLLAAPVIEPAIQMIREQTDQGTINMNTNGGLPDVMIKMLEAGLDSIRISMNSVREEPYLMYFKPKGYGFEDVVRSIDLALEKGRHVAINYLNMPGFTDTAAELESLVAFIEAHPINMIQWRNLNFDPIRYWQAMGQDGREDPVVGIGTVLETIKDRFPEVRHGYFNPPK